MVWLGSSVIKFRNEKEYRNSLRRLVKLFKEYGLDPTSSYSTGTVNAFIDTPETEFEIVFDLKQGEAWISKIDGYDVTVLKVKSFKKFNEKRMKKILKYLLEEMYDYIPCPSFG